MPGPIDTTPAATRVLDSSFDAFDAAAAGDPSQRDGLVTIEDLEAVVANADGRYTQDQVDAARFLSSSTAARSFLDVAAGVGDVDGAIGRDDVERAGVIISGGGLEAALLDTAAGAGTADGYVGGIDLQAAQSDPAIAPSLRRALDTLPPGLPMQTQIDAVVATRQLAGDAPALQAFRQIVSSPAFAGLDEAQQHQALLLFGSDSAASATMRERLGLYGFTRFLEQGETPELGVPFTPSPDNDPYATTAALQDFLRTSALPADAWRNAMPPSGVPDARRQPVQIPEAGRTSGEFPYGYFGTTAFFTDVYHLDFGGHVVEVQIPIWDELGTDVPDELSGQTFHRTSIEDVAKALAAQPPGTLEGVDRVMVNPYTPIEMDDAGNRVPSDASAYWDAADGNTIRINPIGTDQPARTQMDLDFLMAHEVGHSVEQPARALGFGLTVEWNLAVQRDRLFPTTYAGEHYPTPGAEIPADSTEDFAEAYALYQLTRGTPDEVQMRALMPARFELLDRMFG